MIKKNLNKKNDAYYKAKLEGDWKEKLEKKQKQDMGLGNRDSETVNIEISFSSFC